jgi:SAM-dependent methyltransferase
VHHASHESIAAASVATSAATSTFAAPVFDPAPPPLAPPDAWHDAGPAARFLLERHERALHHLLAAIGSDFLDVIDVGGSPDAAQLFAEYGHNVVVQGDADDSLLRFPELARQFPERVRARVGPLSRVPAADGEFDLAISFNTIGHVADWRALLAELCRVSRRWVAIEFAAESRARRIARAMLPRGRRGASAADGAHEVPAALVEAELARQGFHPVAAERQCVLPIALHRMLGRPDLSGSMERVLARAGLAEYLGNPVMLLAERPRGASRALLPFA